MLKLKPLEGYILVEPIEEELQSKGGVILPEVSKDKPMKGKVIAVGGDIFRDGQDRMSPVVVNDLVVYKKWVNETIKEADKELLFVKFEDCLGFYE